MYYLYVLLTYKGLSMKAIVGLILSCSVVSVASQAAEEISVTPYIVGGVSANVANYPYMASLMFEYKTQPGVVYPFCGGSVLDERHILTAAHCVYDTSPSQVANMKVAIEVNDGQGMAAAQKVAVKKIYYPDNYNNSTLINDVAVLELSESLPNYTYKHAVKLGDTSDQDYRMPMTEFTAVGYGRFSTSNDNNGENKSVEFRETQVTYVNPTDCNFWANYTTSNKQVCATGRSFDNSNLVTATCQGDSGGPLIWNGSQIGIVSFGPLICGDGRLNSQSVFTDVSQYKDWIRKAQKGELSSVITVTEDSYSESSGGSIPLGMIFVLSIFGFYRKYH